MTIIIALIINLLCFISSVDAHVAIVRAALRAGTGTQDFTVAGFGTPTAALFIMSGALTDSTVSERFVFSFGCTDGTRQYVVANHDQDNVATTSADSWLSSSNVVLAEIETTGNVEGTADFSAWITDGVRLNVSDAFTAQHLVTVVLINQTVGVYCSIATLNTAQDGTVVVTDPNFTPDVVFGFHRSNASAVNAKDVDAHFGLGIGINDGNDTQMSYHWSANDQQAVTTDIDQRVSSTKIGTAASGAGATTYSIEIDAFSATGFTLITRDAVSPANSFLAYLAIKWGAGFQQALAIIDTPTATGNQSITFPGFRPHFAFTIMTDVESADVDDTNSETFGISVMTQNMQFSTSIFDDDGVTLGVSNVGSISDNQAVKMVDVSQALLFDATLTGFTATGWDWNFAVTPASIRKWIVYTMKFPRGSSNVYQMFK